MLRRLLPFAPLVLVVLAPAAARAWRVDLKETPPDARPFALATDGTGNVVAGGRTPDGEGHSDGVVAKLDAKDGSLRWQQRVTGSGDGNHTVRALLVDAGGNVIVLGQVSNQDTGGDALVMKLRAQDGDPLWRHEIEGGRNGNDDVRAAALLAGGDVVAVGVSPMPGEDDVIAVWRIAASDGHVVWVQTLPGTGGVAQRVVAGGGEIYVASHVPNPDTGGTTIALARLQDDDGSVDWVDVLDGSGEVGDEVTGLALRGTGSVIVAAELHGTTTSPDFVVASLQASAGNQMWRATLDGSAVDAADRDGARAVLVDGNDDVVATGILSEAETQDDLAVVKLRGSDGLELWRQEFEGTATGSEDARDLARDAAGDLLVAGRLRDKNANGDFAVLKLLGTTGELVWRHALDGEAHQSDTAFYVVPDASGNVAAAGRLRNGTDADGFTVVRLAGVSGGSWPCGDGMLEAGEDCDDANPVFGDGCRTDCTVEVCGDGRLDPAEECDDGNVQDGDCCSSTCTLRPDDAICDDGNACTAPDRCEAGVCVGRAEVVCEPPGPCVAATCDPVSGGCVSEMQVDGTRCNDGDACTVTDRCSGGICLGGPPPFCDDADPCTRDQCDAELGCVFPPVEGFDGLLCVFEQRTIQFECRDPLPDPLAHRLSKAELLITLGAAETRAAPARRLLKKAAAQARRAQRFARKRRDRGLLPFRCAQAIVTAMQDLRDRIPAVRHGLR